MDNDTPTRICSKCGVEYPETEKHFRPDKKTQLLRRQCRTCEKEAALKRHYANRDEKLAYMREYHHAVRYPRDAEAIKARVADWRLNNPERNRATKHNAYMKNRSHYAAKSKKYRERHYDTLHQKALERLHNDPSIGRVAKARRRALKYQSGGSHTTQDIRALYEEQGGRCLYCGIRLFWNVRGDIHVDHIMPLSRGGNDAADNLGLTCSHCNCSKKEKTVAEWQVVRGW